MKIVKNLDPDSMFEELKESWRIETKMLMTTKPLSTKEIEFLKAKAEEGSPLGQWANSIMVCTTFYLRKMKKPLKHGGANSFIVPMGMVYGKHQVYLLI